MSKPQVFTVKIDDPGHTAQLMVYTPDTMTGKALPCIIWFHGKGQAKMQQPGTLDSDGLPKYINDGYKLPFDAIVVALQDDWATPSKTAMHYVWTNFILKNTGWNIDKNQVYTAGISFGSMAIAYAEQNADEIAGVVVGSPAALQADEVAALPAFAKKGIPVLIDYGTNPAPAAQEIDKAANAQQYAKSIVAAGGTAVLATENMGHGPWKNLFTEQILFNGLGCWHFLWRYTKGSTANPSQPVTPTPPVDTTPHLIAVDSFSFQIQYYSDGSTKKTDTVKS